MSYDEIFEYALAELDATLTELHPPAATS